MSSEFLSGAVERAGWAGDLSAKVAVSLGFEPGTLAAAPVSSAFSNRLAKNAKHRFKWAKRRGLTAFRLYDLDMPEYPVAVEWYGGYAHAALYPRRDAEALEAEVRAGVKEALQLADDHVFVKVHQRKAWGEEQYGRFSRQSVTTVVEEAGAKFEVNLSDVLDTGLVLDHRETRLRVREEAKDKRVLNLFAYTGAFTVHAALGGAASTTTVDLSNAYCEWAGRNLQLNGFHEGRQHRIVVADAAAWLESERGTHDLVVLDPPSFSSSKRARTFEVQRDHPKLIARARERLAPGGVLYFSTNYGGFELDPSIEAEEITRVPEDFRHAMHRCWRIARPA